MTRKARLAVADTLLRNADTLEAAAAEAEDRLLRLAAQIDPMWPAVVGAVGLDHIAFLRQSADALRFRAQLFNNNEVAL